MVTKVFYEWWGRSTLTIGNKVLVIQKAFAHMGKPAVFDRLMSQCPDLTILLECAKTGVIPALPAENGATSSKVKMMLYCQVITISNKEKCQLMSMKPSADYHQ